MSIRFVVGRAGTGKTRFCFDRIVAAMRAQPLGEPIYWILPKQATFEAERQLTVNSGLNGFVRCRVLSFEQLGQDVLAQCGGAAVPAITAYGRQMILRMLLRKHADQLQFFGRVARQAGLAQKLDNTFAEFEHEGHSLEDLAEHLDRFPTDTPDADEQALHAKLRDLHLLYSAYSSYLGQDRLDPHRRLQQVLSCIDTWPAMRNATVYVDGFLDFSDYERRVLAAVGKVCRDLVITLLIDPASPVLADPHTLPDELSLFHRTERAYRRLYFTFTEENLIVDEPIRMAVAQRFEHPALAEIEQNLLEDRSARPLDNPASVIELQEAPDRRGEADAAARAIRGLLRDGMRLRDIAVLCRDIDDYHELIDASFREHQLPYFVDRRRIVAHHPLLQFTRAALLIARHDWPQEAVMTIIKSGLAGLMLDEADELENYVIAHRIRGRMWASSEPWNYRRHLTRHRDEDDAAPEIPADAQRADALRRRMIDPLRQLTGVLRAKAELPVREIVLALLDLYDAFGVRQTIAQWASAPATSAAAIEHNTEHEQVWAELVELLDQMVDLIGQEPVSLDDFLGIFDAGLEQFDLAITPPTVDQVLVGQIDRTRNTAARAVILLGLNEGLFPRTRREDSILSDQDRRSLHERQINVDFDSERKLLDENLLAYIAFTRASRRLIVIRSLSDDKGRECMPSPYWRQLLTLAPNLRPTVLPRPGNDDPNFIDTPRQLVTALMRWVRRGAAVPAPADGSGDQPASSRHDVTWANLYQWLTFHEPLSDPIDLMRFRAWKALSYDNTAALEPETAARLFPSPLQATVRQLETFAECPFKHFVTYGLRLEAREEDDPSILDLSQIYHQTLDRLVRELLRRRVDLRAMPEELAQELIERCTQEVGATLRGELMMSSARNRYLLQRIERTVAQVAEAQKAIARLGEFAPRWTNLAFGRTGAPLPALSLKTPAGQEVVLSGRIDRVDLLEKDAAFAVIDYRMGARGLDLTYIRCGITIQLLASMLVLREHAQQLAGRDLKPVAGLYMRLLRQLDSISHPDEATDPESEMFHLWPRPRGIVHKDYLTRFDSTLAPGASSAVLSVRLTQSGEPYRNCKDVATEAEMDRLLEIVKGQLAELSDRLIAGEVAIRPYRIGTSSPCSMCSYRPVCRFQPGVGKDEYRFIDPVDRSILSSEEASNG